MSTPPGLRPGWGKAAENMATRISSLAISPHPSPIKAALGEENTHCQEARRRAVSLAAARLYG